MKDKTLKKLIVDLNRGKFLGQISTRILSETVHYTKVWLKKPKKTDPVVGLSSIPEPFIFYLIKEIDGNYVATVFDMGYDLHWYVMPNFRRQGLLCQALIKTILPHLFNTRSEQRVTIDEYAIGKANFIASEKVALKAGFIKTKEENGISEYLLDDEKYSFETYPNGQDAPISKERVNLMQKELQYMARRICILQAEIEMSTGVNDYTMEMKELSQAVDNHVHQLKYFWMCLNNDHD